jgi:O-antigen/teichoic acid export membrane protein
MTPTGHVDGRHGLTERAAALAAAKYVAFAISIALPLVVVRALDQAEYGLYKQAFLVVATVVSLLNLQVAATALSFTPRAPEKRSQIATNVLVFYAAVGTAVGALFVAFPGWIALAFHGDGLVPTAPLIGVAIMFWLVSAAFESIAVANGDVAVASTAIVLSQLGKTALLIVAALAFGTVFALVAATCVYGAVYSAAVLVYMRARFGRFWETFDGGLFKAQVANALPFGAGGLASTALLNLDSYYVSYHFDPSAFAIYSVGCFDLRLLGVLIESAGSVLVPEVARREQQGDSAGIIGLWADMSRKLALAFVPACAFLFVMRDEFVTALFTPTYAAAAPIFAVNLVIIVLGVGVTGPVLRSFPEMRFFRLKLCLALLPLAWVALVVGVRTYGLVGALAAVALVRTIDTAVSVAMIRRRLGAGRIRARAFGPILLVVGAACLAAVAVVPLQSMLSAAPPVIALAVCAPAFAVVYGVAAYATGAVTVAEKAALRALLSHA